MSCPPHDGHDDVADQAARRRIRVDAPARAHRVRRGAAPMIRIKRTYEPPARGDGRRIFVERLWPRGMRKEALAADAWMKDVAPSTALRKWFDHRVERWEDFRRRYRAELDANPGAWKPILESARRGTVTLLYSAHDTAHNGAQVLGEYLAERTGAPKTTRRARPHAAASTTKPASRATDGGGRMTP
jgi:uncharacterized protein YeaO (DUF488 family)